MYIYTEDMFNPQFNYIPYGTIGFVRTNNNEIRMCKMVGATLKKNENNCGAYQLYYEWKVAGIKPHQFTFSTCELTIGTIYRSEIGAQQGGASADRMKCTSSIRIAEYLRNKYGMSKECFSLGGTWYKLFSIETYGVMTNHTIARKPTDFDIVVDENGISVSVPMLDGCVDGVRRYPTYDAAYKAMKPLKVYSLDDDDDEEDEPKPSKVVITIEIETTDIDKVKAFGKIITNK